jgi:gamma-glutamylcyclotransferase (GGCT)/AIG2-like uncharacterized protein YtfP
MHRVFVYGTLKRGMKNYHLIKSATFVGLATSLTEYGMVAREFPVLLEVDSGGRQISGELFEVDDATLARLDELEKEGVIYDRRSIKVVLQDGVTTSAFVYIGRPAAWLPRSWPAYLVADSEGRLDWFAPTT